MMNWALLESLPRGQQFFYLFHELRHGMQYQQSEQFPPFLRESLPYVVLYDENGDPAASVVDGPLVSYGSAPVRLYDNAQALAFGDAFVLLLRTDGTILAWGSNDHGQMADGDWTKAELVDGDDEDEKDVVITESDQFVFPAVIAVPAES